MSNFQHDQIHNAFKRIIEEAGTPTPSGSHKVFVVGQLVINLQGEEAPVRCRGGEGCCGKCHL